jgi:hypothetical protein
MNPPVATPEESRVVRGLRRHCALLGGRDHGLRRSGHIAGLAGARESLRRPDLPLPSQQVTQVKGADGVTALVSSTVSRLSAGHITTLLQQHPEIRRSGPVTPLVPAPEGVDCLVHPALVSEQGAQIERPHDVSALVSSAVRHLGAGHITTLLQQHPEIRCSGGVPQLVRALECIHCFAHVAPLSQQDPEVERSSGIIPRVSVASRCVAHGQGAAPPELISRRGSLLSLAFRTRSTLKPNLT